MFGQGFNSGFFGGPPCFTDTTDIFKDNSGVALYTLDYDASDSGNATGKFNEGAVLTGTSSQINFPDIPLSTFDAATVSVSLWVNMQALTSGYSSGSYIFRGRGNWIIQLTSSGVIFAKYNTGPGNNGNNNLSYNFPGGTSLNNWYHIVVTDNGTATSGLNLYVNGALRDSNSGYANIDDNSWLAGIANYAGRAGGNFKIDQLRIFNKVLSASEVTTLYNETKNTTNTLQILGDTSCIATYPLDGSSTDLSGNYNGTDTNILYKYDGTPTNVDFGVGGKSLYGARFNGSNSAIIVPNNILASNNHSISTWFYLNDTSGIQTLIEFDYGNRIIFRVASTDSNWAYIGSSGYFNHGISFSAGQWYHLAITFSAGSPFKIYVNGNLSYTGGNTNLYLRTVDNIIGAANSSGANGVDGTIDQVRLFNKTLSSTEVSKLYGNGAGEIACKYTATTTDIAYPIANTAYYKLDNNSKALSPNATGKFNQGATIVGNSTGIQNSTLQLSSTAHSVSLWMKPQDLTASKWHIVFGSYFSGGPTFTLGKRPDQTTSFHYRNESSNEVYFTLSTANIWYHIVVTRNNSGSTVYVNGSSVATDSNSMGSYSYSGYQKCVIGSMPNYPVEYFSGTIDQVRVYNVVLTATDVANLYNNETVSTANTLAFPTGKTAIATYKLDGDGVDISGNYSGVGDSNVKYDYSGTDTNIEYKFGRFGQAAVFNGSSSYISAGNPNSGGGARSFSAWIKTTSTAFQSIITNGGASHASGLNMFVYNNKLYSTSGKGNGENYGPSSSKSINTGSWVHCVLTMSGTAIGSTLKTYVNGALDGTHATTVLITDTYNAFRIGARYINGSNLAYFNGSIDQVRIFNSELTSSQVSQLYNEKPETDTSNFKAVLYEGNSSTQYISNVGMDLETNGGLVWLKQRNSSQNHGLFDTVRGVNSFLISNSASNVNTRTTDTLSSFDANGFTLTPYSSDAFINYSGRTMVAWCWKGGGPAVSNTDGTITSQVSANTEAGFSIVKYTGNSTSGATVGHSLDSSPEIIIVKNLDSNTNWIVKIPSVMTDDRNYLYLNDSAAVGAAGSTTFIRTVNSSIFTLGSSGQTNSTDDFIAYCWHSVAGYSKIGTYEGLGTSTVTVSDVGFKPSFIMIKNIDATANWNMYDVRRSTVVDRANKILYPNLSNSEPSATNYYFDMNDNGFIVSATNHEQHNKAGRTYIYMAFK